MARAKLRHGSEVFMSLKVDSSSGDSRSELEALESQQEL